MADEKKKSVKCPVCGCFTSEESVKRAFQQYEAQVKALNVALNEADESNRNLGWWLDVRNKEIETLKDKLLGANAEIAILRNKTWWERLLNW